MPIDAERLRSLTEDDVIAALGNSYVEDTLDGIAPVALLEFYNRMLDRVIGEPDD
jgi:hypothetical protein